jgi:hypothetical protein
MDGEGEVDGGVIGLGDDFIALVLRRAFGRRGASSGVRLRFSESDSDVVGFTVWRESDGDARAPPTGFRVMPDDLLYALSRMLLANEGGTFDV